MGQEDNVGEKTAVFAESTGGDVGRARDNDACDTGLVALKLECCFSFF